MVSSANNDSHFLAYNLGGGVSDVDHEALGAENIVPNQHICSQTIDQV